MLRKTLAVLLSFLTIGTVTAQSPARFRWQAGQVLLYKVDQSIAVTEIVGENKVQTTIKLNITKRWQVLDVDVNGVATIQHSLVALRQETHTGDGKTLIFDSVKPAESSPELKDALSKFVGPILAVLRVDSIGRVVEVKESKFGSTHRYETELPFAGVLPIEALKPALTWDRTYNLTLDPQGAGEKYPAVQHFACKSIANNAAVVSMTTELKRLPEAIADRVPMLQMQPAGDIVFDLANGRMQEATLKIDKELKNFQGENSSIHVVGTYFEQYVGDR